MTAGDLPAFGSRPIGMATAPLAAGPSPPLERPDAYNCADRFSSERKTPRIAAPGPSASAQIAAIPVGLCSGVAGRRKMACFRSL